MKILEGLKKKKVAVRPAEGFKKERKIHALPILIKQRYAEKNQSMAPPLGRMTEEEISLLLFQALKGIEEDLKEIEKVETCTNVGTTLEEKPSCSVMKEDYIVAEEALASTSHQGMIRDSSIVISAHCMKRSTSLHAVDLEKQSCTAL